LCHGSSGINARNPFVLLGCAEIVVELAEVKRRQAEQAAEKVPFDSHSERSEESLFGLNPRKEGFLGKKAASE